MGMDVNELGRNFEHAKEDEDEERRIESDFQLRVRKPKARGRRSEIPAGHRLTAVMTEEGESLRDATLPLEEPIHEKLDDWLNYEPPATYFYTVDGRFLGEAPPRETSWREEEANHHTWLASTEPQPEPEVSHEVSLDFEPSMLLEAMPKAPDLKIEDKAFDKRWHQKLDALWKQDQDGYRVKNFQRGRESFPPRMPPRTL